MARFRIDKMLAGEVQQIVHGQLASVQAIGALENRS